MERKEIYIIGAGIVSAIGIGKAETLDALRNRHTGVAPVQYLKTIHTGMSVGEVKFANFSWQLLASGLSMVVASFIWFYILKHYELSLAYPLISISYIFGTLAAIFFFYETVPFTRWIGVLLIMGGVVLLTR